MAIHDVKRLTDNLKLYKYCFLFALSAIDFFWYVFGALNFNKTCDLILQVINCIIIVALFLCSLSSVKKSFLNPYFCIFALVLIITFFTTRHKRFVLSILAIITCVKDEDIKKIIKIIIIPRIILYFVCLFCVAVKIIPDQISGARFLHGVLKERHSLGLKHPNCNFWLLFPCYCGYLYIRKKIKFWEIALHLVFFFELFHLTGCRAGFYCVIILIFLYLLYSFSPKVLNKLKSLKSIKYIFFVFCVISVGVILVVKNYGTAEFDFLIKRYTDGEKLSFWEQLFVRLDLRTSDRILYGAQALEKYSVSLFGQKTFYDITVDNSFIFMLTSYGLLFTVAFLIFSYFTIKKMQERNDFIAVAIICVYALYFVFEHHFINGFNFIVYLFVVCNKKKELPLGICNKNVKYKILV